MRYGIDLRLQSDSTRAHANILTATDQSEQGRVSSRDDTGISIHRRGLSSLDSRTEAEGKILSFQARTSAEDGFLELSQRILDCESLSIQNRQIVCWRILEHTIYRMNQCDGYPQKN